MLAIDRMIGPAIDRRMDRRRVVCFLLFVYVCWGPRFSLFTLDFEMLIRNTELRYEDGQNLIAKMSTYQVDDGSSGHHWGRGDDGRGHGWRLR